MPRVLLVRAVDRLALTWWPSFVLGAQIAKFEYAIGTDAEPELIAGYTDVGLGLHFAATNLALTSGVTYFTSVRGRFAAAERVAALPFVTLIPSTGHRWAATNNFGEATVQRSDGVRVDVSAPVGCVVSDGPDAGTSLAYQSSDTAIQATWQGLSDVESGIAWLEVGVGTGAGAANTVAFFPVATDQTSVSIDNLALDSRTTYYVTLRATYVARLARCRRSRTPHTTLPSPVQEPCRAVSSVLQLRCPRGCVGSSGWLGARHPKRRVEPDSVAERHIGNACVVERVHRRGEPHHQLRVVHWNGTPHV